MKTAIVTGITGQDGSYLADLLLSKGYFVVGVSRRSSVDNTGRISEFCRQSKNFKLVEGDVTDPSNINFLLLEYKPDEFYNLAAQSHVGTSFSQPHLTWNVNAQGVMYILEGIRMCSPNTRLYQASTSEMFGKNYSEYHPCANYFGKYQDENTPFSPQSPYAVAKLAAHESIGLYRRAYGLHASAGILFNHESERRGENFVTRKITKWLGGFSAAIDEAKSKNHLDYDGPRYFDKDQGVIGFDGHWMYSYPMLRLGNLDAMRDWGHAEDYVYAMWLMLQQDEPDDYVIATGETHTVKEFLVEAFKAIGIDDHLPFVVQDERFMRPAEVDYLRGIPLKAKEKLGWEPSISFKSLVHRMVHYDITGQVSIGKINV